MSDFTEKIKMRGVIAQHDGEEFVCWRKAMV